MALQDDGNARRVVIGAPPGVARYCVPKGSVAVDGVSLTITRAEADRIEVSLIPQTLAETVPVGTTLATR